MLYALGLLLSIISAVVCNFDGTPCIYETLKQLRPEKLIPSVPTEHVKIYSPDGGKPEIQWGTIRIKTFYQKDYRGKFSSSTTTDKHWILAEHFVGKSVKKLESGISVRQIESPVRVPRACQVVESNGTISDVGATVCDKSKGQTCSEHARCFLFDIDDSYADSCYYTDNIHKPAFSGGTGITNADLALFVYIVDCAKAGRARGVLAFATHCGIDSKFNAPTSGIVVFCLDALDKGTDDSGVGIALHEISHILFAGDLDNPLYVDEHGQTVGKNKSYKIVTRKWLNRDHIYEDKQVMLLTHPSLIEFGKKHWGCISFDGIELFNNSGEFAHFNERLYADALLSPLSKKYVTFTELDAIVLETTGWYKVDNCALGVYKMMNMSDKGCDFVTKSCYELFKEAKPGYDLFPYCFRPETTTNCSKNGEQHVLCQTEGRYVTEFFEYGNNYTQT